MPTIIEILELRKRSMVYKESFGMPAYYMKAIFTTKKHKQVRQKLLTNLWFAYRETMDLIRPMFF